MSELESNFGGVGGGFRAGGVEREKSWFKEFGSREVSVPTIGARFNDLFVMLCFSFMIYFIVTGALVMVLVALFFLALFYSPSSEKKPDRKEVSL